VVREHATRDEEKWVFEKRIRWCQCKAKCRQSSSMTLVVVCSDNKMYASIQSVQTLRVFASHGLQEGWRRCNKATFQGKAFAVRVRQSAS